MIILKNIKVIKKWIKIELMYVLVYALLVLPVSFVCAASCLMSTGLMTDPVPPPLVVQRLMRYPMSYIIFLKFIDFVFFNVVWVLYFTSRNKFYTVIMTFFILGYFVLLSEKILMTRYYKEELQTTNAIIKALQR